MWKKLPLEEIIGRRYGRLIAISESPVKGSQGRAMVCTCDCGSIKKVDLRLLRSGNTRSCGCFMKDRIAETSTTHGMCRSVEYKIWSGIKARCLTRTHKQYKDYGGRGIGICESWSNGFSGFFSDMGARPSQKHSVERINNNLGYSKENCKWATIEDQNRNKRTNVKYEYMGESKILRDWASFFGVNYHTFKSRVVGGMSIQMAGGTPVRTCSIETTV